MLRQKLKALRELAYSGREWLFNLGAVPLVVLIYHRVIELPSDPQMLAVSPSRFREQLQALQASFDILRFEQSWADIQRPTVIITFDDGYADNLEYALPILEKLDIPATFFIATGYVGGDREFWWDELERVLLCSSGGEVLNRVGVVDLDRTYDCNLVGEREALYQFLHPQLKTLSLKEREASMAELASVVTGTPEPRSSHRVLSTSELAKLAASPMATIGAHTVCHQPLSSLSIAAQREEIECSRAQLQEWTGRPVQVFSYPFGAKSDYTSETVDICRRTGFCRVAANHPAVVRSWTDPYRVPRFLVRNWSADELMSRLRRFAGL